MNVVHLIVGGHTLIQTREIIPSANGACERFIDFIKRDINSCASEKPRAALKIGGSLFPRVTFPLRVKVV